MKKIIATILIIAYLITFQAPMGFAVEKLSLAVLDLESKGVDSSTTDILTETLRRELVNTKRFNIVDQSQIDDTMEEVLPQMKGCTTMECAIEMGRMVGADKVLRGSISTLGKKYILEVRLIDLESGTVETAKMKEWREGETDYNTAIKNLVNKLVEEIPIQGEIIEVSEDGKTAVINLGKDDGISEGSLFQVFRLGEAVKDEKGDIVLQRQKQIAVLKAVTVDKAGSEVQVLEPEETIAMGDKVILPRQPIKLGDSFEEAIPSPGAFPKVESQKSNKWLWIGLGALAIVGGGLGVALSGGDDGGDGGSGSDEPGISSPPGFPDNP